MWIYCSLVVEVLECKHSPMGVIAIQSNFFNSAQVKIDNRVQDN